jgi:predicted dehydrogenase
MTQKIRWGILGTAKIAIREVIPAMKAGNFCSIEAVASRSIESAREVAEQFGISKAYGSYEELIADPSIDAVYIPLPNHLHAEWTIKAAKHGKHVLCEKPLAMNCAEVRTLIDVQSEANVKIEEAFMVRTHPLWTTARELLKKGRIGKLQSVMMFFSYFNDDPKNIRNQSYTGGGALMDIGCYCVNFSRFIFADEPSRVSALVRRNEISRVDTLTTAILDFPKGHATFTCSTEIAPYQRMQILGTKGRIEIEIPVNFPSDRDTRIYIDDGSDLSGGNIETIEVGAANKFTIQGDLFSEAILKDTPPALSLMDSYQNMAAIDALFRSAETQNWEKPAPF